MGATQSSTCQATTPSNMKEQLYKCPGCAKHYSSRIMLCETGHSVCQECSERLLQCPQCCAIYRGTRNYTLEYILMQMKRMNITPETMIQDVINISKIRAAVHQNIQQESNGTELAVDMETTTEIRKTKEVESGSRDLKSYKDTPVSNAVASNEEKTEEHRTYSVKDREDKKPKELNNFSLDEKNDKDATEVGASSLSITVPPHDYYSAQNDKYHASFSGAVPKMRTEGTSRRSGYESSIDSKDVKATRAKSRESSKGIRRLWVPSQDLSTMCRMRNCRLCIPLSELQDHLHYEHYDDIRTLKAESKSGKFHFEFNTSCSTHRYGLITELGIFFLIVRIEQDFYYNNFCVTSWIQGTCPNEEAHLYYSFIDIEVNDVQATYQDYIHGSYDTVADVEDVKECLSFYVYADYNDKMYIRGFVCLNNFKKNQWQGKTDIKKHSYKKDNSWYSKDYYYDYY